MMTFLNRRKIVFISIILLLVYVSIYVKILLTKRIQANLKSKELWPSKSRHQIHVVNRDDPYHKIHETADASKYSSKQIETIKVIRKHLSRFKTKLVSQGNGILKEYRFSYGNFTLVEPNFAKKEDRELFYKNKVNENDMKNGRTPQQLRGIVAVQKNAIAYEDLDCGWKNNLSDYYPRNMGNEQTVFKGMLCPLLVPDSYAFQHFVDGVMPKLMQVYPTVIQENVYFLIFKPRDTIIYDMYEALGISRKRLVFYSFEPMRVETMINTCIAPPIHPALWQASREALGVSETLTVPWNQTRVVLLHRVQTSNGGRKILNVEEVKKYLFSRYGESSVTVFTGHLSFSESVDLFRKAKIIIGVHGGALYNILFSPRQTTIVEIMPTLDTGNVQPSRLAHEIIWFQSQLLGQTYWRLPVAPANTESDLNVPIDSLDNMLQLVDKSVIK